ncbi:MAG: TIGR03435 family protein [Candidatus Sulfopaludibacter sp.]|nr:TIGR03435 family protein [Candidatus Sulfopaludibacter sp.]
MRTSRNSSALLLLLAASAAFGQRFDVASVKVTETSGAGEGKARRGIKSSPGSVTIQNMPLSAIVQWAYGVRDYQVVGPHRTDVQGYDIFAKAAGPAQEAKGGYKLKPAEGEGAGNLTASKSGKVMLKGERTSMAELAGLLSRPLRRAVIDRTGLKGGFDFTIDLMSYIPLDASGKPSPESTTEMDRDGIIIMAVQQQLGLKLEPGKGPVEMIIIEKADKIPTDN